MSVDERWIMFNSVISTELSPGTIVTGVSAVHRITQLNKW